MGYNTEFPAWLAQDKRDNAQRGAMLGQNILQGLKFQADQRAYQEEEPLRQAKLGTALAQQKMVETQANVTALNAGLMANAQMGQQDALQLEGDIAGRPDGWSDPETPRRVAALIQQYPGLNNTPWHQRMNQNIEVSRKYRMELDQQREANEARLKLQQEQMLGDITVAGMRGAANTNPGFLGVEELVAQGKPVTEALVEVASQSSGPGDFKIRQAAQFIPATVTAMRRAGIPVEDNEVLAFIGDYGGGVASINAPAKVANAIDKEDVVARELDAVTNRINAFNAKYGPKAFDEYIGPLDNPVYAFKTKTLAPSELSAADREARSIFQKVNQTIQNYRVGNFGTALTASETKLFKDIVSSPGFADYTDSIAGFRDNIKDTLKATIGNNKFAANIKLPVKARYLAEDGVTAPAVPAAPATGGGALTRERAAQFLRDAGGDKERARQMARDAGFSF